MKYNVVAFPPGAPSSLVDEVEIKTQWLRSTSNRIAGRFLKKTPLDSLQRAARLPGRALHIYLAIRHRCDLRRSKSVTLPGVYLRSWGIDKHAKSRALAELELSGLIAVERRRGRPAVVSLL